MQLKVMLDELNFCSSKSKKNIVVDYFISDSKQADAEPRKLSLVIVKMYVLNIS